MISKRMVIEMTQEVRSAGTHGDLNLDLQIARWAFVGSVAGILFSSSRGPVSL